MQEKKNACINSMEISESFSFCIDFDKHENETCVNMFSIKFKVFNSCDKQY